MKAPLVKLNSGNTIPQIGLGTWQLTGDALVKALDSALKMGYTHIDTAEAYFNQAEIGKLIKKKRRESLFITSKVWRTNLSYEDTIASVNESLKQLNTNYIDLILIHWPNKDIPLKETFRAFKVLKSEGKIKSVGVSNFNIKNLEKAIKIAQSFNIKISVNQVEFHPYLYQKDLLQFCNKNKIALTAYSPLGRGEILNDPRIRNISQKYKSSPAKVVLSWELSKGIIVIPKSSSRQHLQDNLDSIKLKLSKEDLAKIDSLNKNYRAVNPEWAEF